MLTYTETRRPSDGPSGNTFWICIALIAVIIVSCVHAARGGDYSAERSSVVVVKSEGSQNASQCSGVNVSPDGLVLTAKHCGYQMGDQVLVLWPSWQRNGSEYQCGGRVIYVADEWEGPVAVKLSGQADLPYSRVAKSIPPAGARVYTRGYPGGNYSYLEGKLLGGTEIAPSKHSPNKVRVNQANFRVASGHSGGPLFNESGEVVGLATGTATDPDVHDSVWIGCGAVIEAYAVATGKRPSRVADSRKRPVVYCVTAEWCVPCKPVKSDHAAGVLSAFDIRFVDYDREPEKVRAIEQAAGKKIEGLPAFWVAGRREVKTGYDRPTTLAWFKDTLRLPVTVFEDIESIFRPQRRPVPVPDPISTSPEPYVRNPESKAVEPAIEWSDVTVLLLVAKQDVGIVRGKLRSTALSFGIGPIERALQSATDGKATLRVIAERNEPALYAAVTNAAEVNVDKFMALVLVAKQPIGLKALIAGKVERSIAEKLEDVPVDLIFERGHSDHYKAVVAAMETTEPTEQPVEVVATDDQPDPPAEQPKRDHGWLYLGTAWAIERLKLLRKLKALKARLSA